MHSKQVFKTDVFHHYLIKKYIRRLAGINTEKLMVFHQYIVKKYIKRLAFINTLKLMVFHQYIERYIRRLTCMNT